MNKPKLLPIQENFEIPADVQEQMRRIEQLTPEDRKALIEAQRAADPGEKVPFAVWERQYFIESLLRHPPKKSE